MTNPLKAALAAASLAGIGIVALAVVSPADPHDRVVYVPAAEPQQPPMALLGLDALRPTPTYSL